MTRRILAAIERKPHRVLHIAMTEIVKNVPGRTVEVSIDTEYDRDSVLTNKLNELYTFVSGARVFLENSAQCNILEEHPFRQGIGAFNVVSMRRLSRLFTPDKHSSRGTLFVDHLGVKRADTVAEVTRQLAEILPNVAPETDKDLDTAIQIVTGPGVDPQALQSMLESVHKRNLPFKAI